MRRKCRVFIVLSNTVESNAGFDWWMTGISLEKRGDQATKPGGACAGKPFRQSIAVKMETAGGPVETARSIGGCREAVPGTSMIAVHVPERLCPSLAGA